MALHGTSKESETRSHIHAVPFNWVLYLNQKGGQEGEVCSVSLALQREHTVSVLGLPLNLNAQVLHMLVAFDIRATITKHSIQGAEELCTQCRMGIFPAKSGLAVIVEVELCVLRLIFVPREELASHVIDCAMTLDYGRSVAVAWHIDKCLSIVTAKRYESKGAVIMSNMLEELSCHCAFASQQSLQWLGRVGLLELFVRHLAAFTAMGEAHRAAHHTFLEEVERFAMWTWYVHAAELVYRHLTDTLQKFSAPHPLRFLTHTLTCS